jgi:GxxExxY protein
VADILYKELSDEIIGVCIEVHKLMGSHFSEKVYEACVQRDLRGKGHNAERQKWIDIFFRGEKLDEQYRIDMLVDNKIIIEFKTVPDLDNSQTRQLLCYLEATIYEVGYVVNFSRNRLQFRRLILENNRKKYKPIFDAK